MQYKLRTIGVGLAVSTGLGGLYVCLVSVLMIFRHFIVPVYWDEWEIARYIASAPRLTGFWYQIFQRHNEHIIAPTKISLLLDYLLFDFSNLPLVSLNVILVILTAILFASLTLYGYRPMFIRVFVIICLVSCGLSLVQYENLLWGFQSQFEFVEVGALSSLLLAIKLTETPIKRPEIVLIGLCLSMGLCIFSMGNGIILPPFVLLILLIRRASPIRILTVGTTSILYSILFYILTFSKVVSGDMSVKTPWKLGVFFVTMIGSPLSNDRNAALILGSMFIIVLSFSALRLIVAPLYRGKTPDGAMLGIFAYAGFLSGTAAGAAWARTSLGIEVALSSRYSTPMLLLWMTPFAMFVRSTMLSSIENNRKYFALSLIQLAAFLLILWTDARPEVMERLVGFEMPPNQAAYAIMSTPSKTTLSTLYPRPNAVEPTLAFLRNYRLNLYSPIDGIEIPKAKRLEEEIAQQPLRNCNRYFMESLKKTDSDSWTLDGWTLDLNGRPAKWIVAVDQLGRIIAYTRPMLQPEETLSALKPEKWAGGFQLNFQSNLQERRHFRVVAIAPDGVGCLSTNIDLSP